jgi:branched-chain amino acid transport system permease protein
MLQLIAFSTLNGVLYGMLLFMMASGLTLIFSMMGVLNFAHASFYMLGAYFGFEISRRIGFWPGLILAPLMVGAIGSLVERYGLRRLHRRGHVSELLFTFGLAFVIEELVQMAWGKLPVDYRVPPQLDFVAFRLHLSRLSPVHAAHSLGDVRGPSDRAYPHAGGVDHSGRADPSRYGGDARP